MQLLRKSVSVEMLHLTEHWAVMFILFLCVLFGHCGKTNGLIYRATICEIVCEGVTAVLLRLWQEGGSCGCMPSDLSRDHLLHGETAPVLQTLVYTLLCYA
jgi:hypothetical protein